MKNMQFKLLNIIIKQMDKKIFWKYNENYPRKNWSSVIFGIVNTQKIVVYP